MFTQLEETRITILCGAVALNLRDGQIVLSGVTEIDFTRQEHGALHLAVVGGTGRYVGADGVASLVPREQPENSADMTIELR